MYVAQEFMSHPRIPNSHPLSLHYNSKYNNLHIHTHALSKCRTLNHRSCISLCKKWPVAPPTHPPLNEKWYSENQKFCVKVCIAPPFQAFNCFLMAWGEMQINRHCRISSKFLHILKYGIKICANWEFVSVRYMQDFITI